MVKTTIYLPDDVKRELERLAAETGRSEAELIRDGIQLMLHQRTPPLARAGIFASGQANLSERVDELLNGFGER